MFKYFFCFWLVTGFAFANQNDAVIDGNNVNEHVPAETVKDLKLIESQLKDEEHKKQNLKPHFITSLLSAEQKNAVELMMAQNPFAELSENDVRTLLMAKAEGTMLGNAFHKNPKLLNMTVAVIRHEKALPQFFSILNQNEKLQKWSYAFFTVMAFSFLFGLFYHGKTFTRRILAKTGVFIFTFAMNIGLFYYFFKTELAPTIEVVKSFY